MSEFYEVSVNVPYEIRNMGRMLSRRKVEFTCKLRLQYMH